MAQRKKYDILGLTVILIGFAWISLLFASMLIQPGALQDVLARGCLGVFSGWLLLLLALGWKGAKGTERKQKEEELASEKRWQNLKKKELEASLSREVPRELVVLREVLTVPCRYCGASMEATLLKCPNCNAPRG